MFYNKMAIEEGLTKYRLGPIASQLAEAGDVRTATKTLDKLVLGLPGVNADDVKPLLEGTKASREGINTAVSVYETLYERARGKIGLSEMFDYYSGTINKFFSTPDELKKVKDVFDVYSGETYGSIKKRIVEAQNIRKNPDIYNEADVKSATATLQKYQKVMTLIEALEKYENRNLLNPIAEDSEKEQIRELVLK